MKLLLRDKKKINTIMHNNKHNMIVLSYKYYHHIMFIIIVLGLGIKAKKCPYEGVIVITALYGAEAWGMISAEKEGK